jgi:hypothetical protein
LGSRKLRTSEIFPTVGSAAGERATEAEVMKRPRRSIKKRNRQRLAAHARRLKR